MLDTHQTLCLHFEGGVSQDKSPWPMIPWPGQVFKLSRGGLPDIISLMQIYLPLLIQYRPTSVYMACCAALWTTSGVPNVLYERPETNIFTDYSLQIPTNIFAKCRLISLQSILISLRYNPCTIIFAPPPSPQSPEKKFCFPLLAKK